MSGCYWHESGPAQEQGAVLFAPDGIPLAEVWHSDKGEWSVTGFAGQSVRRVIGLGAEGIAREIAQEIADEQLG